VGAHLGHAQTAFFGGWNIARIRTRQPDRKRVQGAGQVGSTGGQEVGAGPVTDSLRLLLLRGNHTLHHLLEVRRALEVSMAALAAQRRTDENLAAMERYLEIMREKPDEPDGYIDADIEFHTEIARGTGPGSGDPARPRSELMRESRLVSFSGAEVTRVRPDQHQANIRDDSQGRRRGGAMALIRYADGPGTANGSTLPVTFGCGGIAGNRCAESH
jgi:hypothetical protein